MRFILLAAVAGFAPFLAAQQRPEALQELEAYRSGLRTGEIEWSMVDHLPKASAYRHEIRFKTSRFAGPDLMTIERGDAEGVVLRTTAGTVSEIGGAEPYYHLAIEGQSWQRPRDPLQPAMLFPSRAAPDASGTARRRQY